MSRNQIFPITYFYNLLQYIIRIAYEHSKSCQIPINPSIRFHLAPTNSVPQCSIAASQIYIYIYKIHQNISKRSKQLVRMKSEHSIASLILHARPSYLEGCFNQADVELDAVPGSGDSAGQTRCPAKQANVGGVTWRPPTRSRVYSSDADWSKFQKYHQLIEGFLGLQASNTDIKAIFSSMISILIVRSLLFLLLRELSQLLRLSWIFVL